MERPRRVPKGAAGLPPTEPERVAARLKRGLETAPPASSSRPRARRQMPANRLFCLNIDCENDIPLDVEATDTNCGVCGWRLVWRTREGASRDRRDARVKRAEQEERRQ